MKVAAVSHFHFSKSNLSSLSKDIPKLVELYYLKYKPYKNGSIIMSPMFFVISEYQNSLPLPTHNANYKCKCFSWA